MSSDEYTEKRHRAILLRAWSVLETIKDFHCDSYKRGGLVPLPSSLMRDIDRLLDDITNEVAEEIPLPPRVRE